MSCLVINHNWLTHQNKLHILTLAWVLPTWMKGKIWRGPLRWCTLWSCRQLTITKRQKATPWSPREYHSCIVLRIASMSLPLTRRSAAFWIPAPSRMTPWLNCRPSPILSSPHPIKTCWIRNPLEKTLNSGRIVSQFLLCIANCSLLLSPLAMDWLGTVFSCYLRDCNAPIRYTYFSIGCWGWMSIWWLLNHPLYMYVCVCVCEREVVCILLKSRPGLSFSPYLELVS